LGQRRHRPADVLLGLKVLVNVLDVDDDSIHSGVRGQTDFSDTAWTGRKGAEKIGVIRRETLGQALGHGSGQRRRKGTIHGREASEEIGGRGRQARHEDGVAALLPGLFAPFRPEVGFGDVGEGRVRQKIDEREGGGNTPARGERTHI
jgi:hypothetical protein